MNIVLSIWFATLCACYNGLYGVKSHMSNDEHNFTSRRHTFLDLFSILLLLLLYCYYHFLFSIYYTFLCMQLNP